MRHRARDLRLRFVNTTGTATPVARLRTRLRGSRRRGQRRAQRRRRAPAQADTSQPAIVPREQWASDKCPPRADPVYGQVKMAFIHHTVSANEYGPEDSAAMVLGICRYHRNGNGWNDIGYNFLVDRYGTIFEGRAGGIAEAVDRRAGAGLQLELDRHRQPRHVQHGRSDPGRAWPRSRAC